MGLEKMIGKTTSSLSNFSEIIKQFDLAALSSVQTMGAFQSGLDHMIGTTDTLRKALSADLTNMNDFVTTWDALRATMEKSMGFQECSIKNFQQLAQDVANIGTPITDFQAQLLATGVNLENIGAEMARNQKKLIQYRQASFALLGTMFGLDFITRAVGKTFSKLTTPSLALQGLMEDLEWSFEDIADTLMDSLEPQFDVIAGIVEFFADLIDEQPEIVKQFLGMLLLLTPIALGLASAFTQLVVAVFALSSIGGISGLLTMFGGAVTTAGSAVKTFLSMPLAESLGKIKTAIVDVASSAWNWIKSIPSFVGGMFTANASALTLGQTIGILAIGVMAAFAAFMLIDSLLSGLDSSIRKPVAAIVALIAAIVAATVAWMAFHGTVTVGVAVPIILAAVGAGIAGIKALVSMETGGITKGEGLAYLHPNEAIVPLPPAHGMATEEPYPITINVYASAGMNERELARKVADEIDKRRYEKSKARQY